MQKPERLPELTISPETAFFILMKAREFDEKTESAGLEDGSNPSDDHEVAVLEEGPDDPVEEELAAALAGLNVDERFDLLALTWIGRGDFEIGDWKDAQKAAREMAHEHIPSYLMGTPLFSDYLEAGLALAGHDLDEFERKHF